MARVELTDEALAEAERASKWYRENAGKDAASRFAEAIAAALGRIGAAPGRWPTIAHGAQRVLVSRFPYAIVYLVHEGVAVVIAVAHQKRRPEYWKRRARSKRPPSKRRR